MTDSSQAHRDVDLPVPVESDIVAKGRGRSWAMRSLLRNRGAIAGLAGLLVVVLAALLSTWIVPHDPTLRDITRRLEPPMSVIDGELFVLGTDAVGRDILSRIIYGTRITLVVGLASVALAGTVGMVLGLLAGYSGGWLDTVIIKENKNIILKAVKALDLELAGIDIECQDIQIPIPQSKGGILEANHAPSIRIHEDGMGGKENFVSMKIMRSFIYKHPFSYIISLFRYKSIQILLLIIMLGLCGLLAFTILNNKI